ncbi:hypothetical protein FCM35_KLT02987 [Carex littledalei]|uniref:Uncharacterized protein n=1 Tax=Carex littledalei TaxID=544730 RepID=A0A833R873_9POAL|nr:hypothetical protein FCM35_KLT02987 [Carex littledalei]
MGGRLELILLSSSLGFDSSRIDPPWSNMGVRLELIAFTRIVVESIIHGATYGSPTSFQPQIIELLVCTLHGVIPACKGPDIAMLFYLKLIQQAN